MRFGTLVATVINIMSKKGASPTRWFDIFRPLRRGLDAPQPAKMPTTYQEYLAVIQANQAETKRQAAALKAQVRTNIEKMAD